MHQGILVKNLVLSLQAHLAIIHVVLPVVLEERDACELQWSKRLVSLQGGTFCGSLFRTHVILTTGVGKGGAKPQLVTPFPADAEDLVVRTKVDFPRD